MLPPPASFHSRKYSGPHHQRRLRDILLTRARITNLAFFLLLGFSVISLFVNLSYYFFTEPPKHVFTEYLSPYSILATIERDQLLRSLDHLVIVPGHAIWKGSDAEESFIEDEWIMESFQQGDKAARITAYHKHISKGIDITANDPKALLVFSGGHTKKESTSTEAESYMRFAQVNGLLPSNHEGFPRVTTEDDALDSYQNLLFSIARFHEYTGRYPQQITVIGYEMKRRRFVELHREAIKWPEDKFHYIGMDAEGQDLDRAREGEKNNGYLPYLDDIYGCHDLLLAKRRGRNPHARFHSYYTSAPELAALFNWCPNAVHGGQTAVFTGSLPWDHLH